LFGKRVVIYLAKLPELMPGKNLVSLESEKAKANTVLGREPGIFFDRAFEAGYSPVSGFMGSCLSKRAKDYLLRFPPPGYLFLAYLDKAPCFPGTRRTPELNPVSCHHSSPPSQIC